jgi:hypothetical protein
VGSAVKATASSCTTAAHLVVEAEPNGKVDLCDSSGTVDLLVDIGGSYSNRTSATTTRQPGMMP